VAKWSVLAVPRYWIPEAGLWTAIKSGVFARTVILELGNRDLRFAFHRTEISRIIRS